MFLAPNLVASQLNRSYSGNNTSSLAEDIDTDGFDANEGVSTEFGNDVEVVNANGEGSSAISGANQQSQSTFAEGKDEDEQPLKKPLKKSQADVKGKKKKQVRQSTVSKQNGKKTKAFRYNIRKKGNKKYEAVEDSDESDEGSDFYVDSDYDLQ
ncbi:hypothetical protein M0R45_036427 [Rubus argutus]|uniref:Uncharacterized protein n=1 Tax=Rubus argutus TaxID=59490 RepID=A0AAW1VW43_RUBAR